MVTSISSNSNSVSNWADSIFSKLDTKNQGYIDKTDLQDALSKVSGDGKGGGRSVNVDDTFSALDADQDGKITKSELTDAMTKLSDQLNAQFDAARVGRGGGGGQAPAGPPPGGQGGSTGATDASSSSSSSSDYIAAADTDGNGTVSEAEKAAYEKKLANAQADGGSSADGSSASDGTRHARHQKDPVRELAHAMHLLKAYAENSGGNGSTASTGSTDGASDSGTASGSGNLSVSVEA